MGRNITNFQVEDIFAVFIKISIGCFFAFFDRFIVFLFCLFFLFDNALNPHLAECCWEFVDAGIGSNRKAILHLEEFICGVQILLGESNVGDGVDNFKMIFR